MKYWLTSGILLAGLTVCSAQQPDNTKTNQRTQSSADQAKNGTSDVKLAAQIRRAIVKDKSLSTYGHNIKVVVKDGKVTLRGPVHSN